MTWKHPQHLKYTVPCRHGDRCQFGMSCMFRHPWNENQAAPRRAQAQNPTMNNFASTQSNICSVGQPSTTTAMSDASGGDTQAVNSQQGLTRKMCKHGMNCAFIQNCPFLHEFQSQPLDLSLDAIPADCLFNGSAQQPQQNNQQFTELEEGEIFDVLAQESRQALMYTHPSMPTSNIQSSEQISSLSNHQSTWDIQEPQPTLPDIISSTENDSQAQTVLPTQNNSRSGNGRFQIAVQKRSKLCFYGDKCYWKQTCPFQHPYELRDYRPQQVNPVQPAQHSQTQQQQPKAQPQKQSLPVQPQPQQQRQAQKPTPTQTQPFLAQPQARQQTQSLPVQSQQDRQTQQLPPPQTKPQQDQTPQFSAESQQRQSVQQPYRVQQEQQQRESHQQTLQAQSQQLPAQSQKQSPSAQQSQYLSTQQQQQQLPIQQQQQFSVQPPQQQELQPQQQFKTHQQSQSELQFPPQSQPLFQPFTSMTTPFSSPALICVVPFNSGMIQSTQPNPTTTSTPNLFQSAPNSLFQQPFHLFSSQPMAPETSFGQTQQQLLAENFTQDDLIQSHQELTTFDIRKLNTVIGEKILSGL